MRRTLRFHKTCILSAYALKGKIQMPRKTEKAGQELAKLQLPINRLNGHFSITSWQNWPTHGTRERQSCNSFWKIPDITSFYPWIIAAFGCRWQSRFRSSHLLSNRPDLSVTAKDACALTQGKIESTVAYQFAEERKAQLFRPVHWVERFLLLVEKSR